MGQFRCSVDGFLTCLHNDSVCDGMEDCDHGEDENEEQCKSARPLDRNILSQIELGLGNRREEGGIRGEG